jgi:hypothetical protein
MSLVHSTPSIVTDSLALCLDAVNVKSYLGSGTTWSDLSGNNNTATMHGVVPVETDIVKCFNFATVTGSASNASLGFTFGSNMVERTNNFTFSAWIKNPPSSSAQVGFFSNTGVTDGYRFGIGLNGIYYLIGPSYKENTINFLSPMSSSAWNNVVLVFSRSTQTMKL